MLADLPTQCDYGTKQNSKGVKETWRGYKLHLDVDDHGIRECSTSNAIALL